VPTTAYSRARSARTHRTSSQKPLLESVKAPFEGPNECTRVHTCTQPAARRRHLGMSSQARPRSPNARCAFAGLLLGWTPSQELPTIAMQTPGTLFSPVPTPASSSSNAFGAHLGHLGKLLDLVTEHERDYRQQELRVADLTKRLADCEAAVNSGLSGCVSALSRD